MNLFLDNFHFLRPYWLFALAGLPVALWAWRDSLRAADPWRRICDPALLPHLAVSSGPRRGAGAAPWLFGMGYLVLVLALSGPAFRQGTQPVLRLQSPLIVAVDLSERMRATDLTPDRMARLRFKLADLLARRGEGQTALVAYAGDAFTVAPLTDDAASLADLASALSPDVMPLQGQRADRAIHLALQLMRDAGQSQGDMVLMTDGVDARAIEAAAKAHAEGLEVSVIGVGTAQGAPVPKARGGFLQDSDGNILIPKLDADALQRLARAGGGRYAPMSVDAADMRALAVVDARQSSAVSEGDDAAQRQWRDEGPWLLLALLPLAALAFRRGWLACLALLAVLPTAPAQAFEWKDLWQRPDQRAWEALQAGDAATARELARDPGIEASAAYREGDFAAAERGFAQRDDATGNYNRGNALAREGHYEEALSAYSRALEQQPDFPDAKANRDAVEEWLSQQAQQSQQKDGDSSGAKGGGKDGDGSPQQGGEGAPDGQEDGSDSSQQDNSSQEEGDRQDGQSQQGASSESDQQGRNGDDRQGQPGTDDSEADPGQASPAAESSEQFSQEMQQALEQAQGAPDQDGEQEGTGQPATTLSPEEVERQQAMEHLLQRVPDDPGGLLRRKFQLEFQRRQEGYQR